MVDYEFLPAQRNKRFIVAYLRIIVNEQDDEEAIKRIINYPVQEELVKQRSG